MTRILFTAAALTLATLAATTASAGCNPACKEGEQCRYNAEVGKQDYTCEKIKSFQSGGKGIGGGSTLSPSAKVRSLGN